MCILAIDCVHHNCTINNNSKWYSGNDSDSMLSKQQYDIETYRQYAYMYLYGRESYNLRPFVP